MKQYKKLSENKCIGGASINRVTRNREIPLPILYSHDQDSQDDIYLFGEHFHRSKTMTWVHGQYQTQTLV